MITEKQKIEYKKMNQNDLNDELIFFCTLGEIDKVRYLLTSPELQKHANIHAQDDASLIEACRYGKLEIIKFLLTSTDLKEHAYVNAQQNQALTYACNFGYFDIIKYLLTSSELKEHADIKNNKSFLNACEKGHLEIIEYFIFDFHIELTNEIKQYLINEEESDISMMFEKRNFHEKLHTKFNNNNNPNIPYKIKI